MKRENIDEDVWEFVAQKYGRFGDTWCDALRRGLELPTERSVIVAAQDARSKPDNQKRISERRLTHKIVGKEISFRFGDDPWRTLKLPANKENKQEVRRVREEALEFGNANGASPGQLNAIRKAFSEEGYYLNGPHQ